MHNWLIAVLRELFFCIRWPLICLLFFVLFLQGPSCWDDVLLPDRIHGVCQSEDCNGRVAVRESALCHHLILTGTSGAYFKCIKNKKKRKRCVSHWLLASQKIFGISVLKLGIWSSSTTFTKKNVFGVILCFIFSLPPGVCSTCYFVTFVTNT